jgi:hypothetical protein
MIIFIFISIIFITAVCIYLLIKDLIKKKYIKHCLSLFQPGNIVKCIDIVGHVKPVEYVRFEYEIVASKENYFIANPHPVNKSTNILELEKEFCISSTIRFYDVVDVYDKNENLIERIYSQKFKL